MSPESSRSSARVLLIQWAGDYREAYTRLSKGESENYYAQKYSVEEAGELAKQYAAYGVLCLTGTERHDELMPNGVRSLGVNWGGSPNRHGDITKTLSDFRPTHVVLTTPQTDLLLWVLATGVELLPQFADTFQLDVLGKSLPRRILARVKFSRYCRRLAAGLNSPKVRWVSNHNVGACQNLVRLGVDPRKVVPWDWPTSIVVRPTDNPVKSLSPAPAVRTLVFVGSIIPSKGVGDVVGAVAELKKRGLMVRARIIGRGEMAPFIDQAKASGVTDEIEFVGPLPHEQVVSALKSADVSLVPSWHVYPEGLPFTIYETFATRTPLVCSDHPAFRDRVSNGRASISVPQRSPIALAQAVEDILSDPDRYRRMSEATAEAWAQLICPVSYYDLIRRWVSATPSDDAWLAEHNLASGRYDNLGK